MSYDVVIVGGGPAAGRRRGMLTTRSISPKSERLSPRYTNPPVTRSQAEQTCLKWNNDPPRISTACSKRI